MPLPSRALGVLSIPALTVPLAFGAAVAAAPSAAAAVRQPPAPSRSLPSTLDVTGPYVGQVYCDPQAKPGVTAFATLMSQHYGLGSAAWGITRNCNSGVTEHSEGRAWDWMLNSAKPNEKATADSVVTWLTARDSAGRPGAMARRFGIMYIIWNRKMWRAYAPERGWAPYSGSSPHTDHVHFSFTWDGAMKRTSWWTGTARTVVGGAPSGLTRVGSAPAPSTPTPATPTPTTATGYPDLRSGSNGADVLVLQRALRVTADGAFGPQTQRALSTWQQTKRLPATGVADQATWAALVSSGLAPARTAAAAPAPTRPVGTPLPTKSGQWSGFSVVKTTTVYTPLKTVRLSTGSTGTAVRTLQAALGGLTVDGSYGSRTEAAVSAYRRSAGLPATKGVDRAVWDALERRDHPFLADRQQVLRQGSTGDLVRRLQSALRITADGVYGSGTAAAVKAVQKRAGLAQTGVVASVTWMAVEAQTRRR